MRDFLNAILTFIGTSTLTDDEFEEFEDLVYGYNIATYNAVKMLLIERDETTETTERLKFYFSAKGLDVDPVAVEETAKSNIFIGASLG